MHQTKKGATINKEDIFVDTTLDMQCWREKKSASVRAGCNLVLTKKKQHD